MAATASTGAVAATDASFGVEDLSPSSAASYWTPSTQQLIACVVGHPTGSTASSSSSFVDDESVSYEDITYNCSTYGVTGVPSSAAAMQTATASCDFGGAHYAGNDHHHLHHPHHSLYGGGYYDGGTGYGHQAGGYDDKPLPPPPAYDNNNAADACDMNVVAYDDPYAARIDRQQVRLGRAR